MQSFESLCDLAMQRVDELQWGHAERYLEQAQKIADTSRWRTSEEKETRVFVRKLKVDLLKRTGAIAGALDVINELMVIHAAIHQQHSFELCAEKVDLLLQLKRFSEAHGTIDGMIERGVEGEGVCARVLKARCYTLENRADLADREMVVACSELQNIETSERLRVAMYLHEHAILAKERDDSERAHALADLAIEALSRWASSQGAESMLESKIKLFKADVYDQSGQFEVALQIRQNVLSVIEDRFSADHLEAFKLRDLIADSLFYHGRLDEAEALYRNNVTYARQDDRKRFLKTGLASLTDFCENTGRFSSLQSDVQEFMARTDISAEGMLAFSTRMYQMARQGTAGRQRAVDCIKGELRNLSNPSNEEQYKTRCKLFLLIASLVKHHDRELCRQYLDEAESLAMNLPEEDAKEVFARLRSFQTSSEVEEGTMPAEIEKLHAALAKNSEDHKLSRPYVEAMLRRHLGCAYLADGQVENSVSELERSRAWLEENNSTECKLYGEVLFFLAEALERQFHDVAELRSTAKEILKQYGKEER